MNSLSSVDQSVTYWRDGDAEVDFVVTAAGEDYAIEVKSGRAGKVSGLDSFRQLHSGIRALLVGGGGIPLEDFLSTPATEWFRGG